MKLEGVGVCLRSVSEFGYITEEFWYVRTTYECTSLRKKFLPCVSRKFLRISNLNDMIPRILISGSMYQMSLTWFWTKLTTHPPSPLPKNKSSNEQKNATWSQNIIILRIQCHFYCKLSPHVHQKNLREHCSVSFHMYLWTGHSIPPFYTLPPFFHYFFFHFHGLIRNM